MGYFAQIGKRVAQRPPQEGDICVVDFIMLIAALTI